VFCLFVVFLNLNIKAHIVTIATALCELIINFAKKIDEGLLFRVLYCSVYCGGSCESGVIKVSVLELK
jgi:hypothetical protein